MDRGLRTGDVGNRDLKEEEVAELTKESKCPPPSLAPFSVKSARIEIKGSEAETSSSFISPRGQARRIDPPLNVDAISLQEKQRLFINKIRYGTLFFSSFASRPDR